MKRLNMPPMGRAGCWVRYALLTIAWMAATQVGIVRAGSRDPFYEVMRPGAADSYKARESSGYRTLRYVLLSSGLIAAGLADTVHAQYKDPLDLAALKMPSVTHSLLVDITQVDDRLVAVGERGHIVYSDNQGQDWKQADVAVRTQLNAVCFSGDQQGWAVGEDAAIVHTSDGGLSWQKQFDARDADLQGPLLDVYFKNAREGFAVGVFDKLYHTVDGGKTWIDWHEHADNPDEWHFFAITATDHKTLYMASEKGLLFRSVDGGDHFSPIQTDYQGSFHGILAKRGSDGQDRLILSGAGGKLFTSTDGGKTLRELHTQTQVVLADGSWLADGSALIVGADGVLLKVSSDLQSVTPHEQENGLPLNTAIQVPDGGYVLVGLGGIQAIEHLPGSGEAKP